MNIKKDTANTALRERPLIFLDIEATGLEIHKHEIIEIGALKVSPRKPFKVIGTINIKVKPQHLGNADKDALKIVHFSEEGWKSSESLELALKLLDDFAENGVLIGYNVSFDWAFLDKAYYELGRQDPFYYHRIDVMSIAYTKLYSKRKVKRFSLGQVCDYLGVKRGSAHQALEDARVTYEVFKKLMKI